MELESKNSDFLGSVFFRAKHSVIAKNRFAVLWQCFAMTIIYPQRARGTHRAEGATLLPTGKNIASSLLQGIPSGRLPRYARNDIVLRTE